MPRRLDSIERATYLKHPEIAEDDLSRVLELLPLDDPNRAADAREALLDALCVFYTSKRSVVRARSRDDCLNDLENLIGAFDPGPDWQTLHRASVALERLANENPVLERRLKMSIGSAKVRALRHRRWCSDDELLMIAAGMPEAIRNLSEEIRGEIGSGRPAELPAQRFARRVFGLWRDFTPAHMGTSRRNRHGGDSSPFHQFLRAAGRLVDPDFNGNKYARTLHEEWIHRPQ